MITSEERVVVRKRKTWETRAAEAIAAGLPSPYSSALHVPEDERSEFQQRMNAPFEYEPEPIPGDHEFMDADARRKLCERLERSSK